MNARAQRARQNKRRITSFGLTSQREITMQNRYSSKFNRQIAIYGECPCSTRVYTIEMSSDQNAPKRRIEVHIFLNVSSFGRMVIRATVLPQIYARNSTQEQN